MVKNRNKKSHNLNCYDNFCMFYFIFFLDFIVANVSFKILTRDNKGTYTTHTNRTNNNKTKFGYYIKFEIFKIVF